MSGRINRPEKRADRRTGGGLKLQMPMRVPGLECATENLGDISCRQDESSGLAMMVLQKQVCLPSSGKRETGLSDDGKTED
ncbi:hypothetical protein [Rhizobium sp. R635]|uniref:hypothetical protein n=1 Tax=unclassified Rhizobium TaxID=2613769 RepID=UPI0011308141|nr:hypothetical protein [Rhizobium sp. R635]